MSELYEQMRGAAEDIRNDRERSRRRLEEVSRRRLLTIVQGKVRTTFVGALAAFEMEVGDLLWGHGLPEEMCDEGQRAWRRVWYGRVRPAVLDLGNLQLRSLRDELELYRIIYQGYRTTLTAVGEDREEGTDGEAEGGVQGQG